MSTPITPYYPISLPEISRFNGKSVAEVLADEGDGPRSARRRSRVPEATAQIEWQLFGDDFKVFDSWRKAELLNHHRWFRMRLPSGGGMLYHVVRFIKKPESRLKGHKFWSITAEIYVRERRFVGPTTYAFEILQDGPIAYWKLNESSGANVAVDSGSLGTAVNASLNTAKAQFGGASLDGVGTSLDYTVADLNPPLVAPYNSAFNFGAGDFTFSVIIKTSNVAARGRHLLDRENANVAYPNFDWYLNDTGNPSLRLFTNISGPIALDLAADTAANDGQRHIVCVRRRNGIVQLIQDFQITAEQVFTGALFTDTKGVGIGGNYQHSGGSDTLPRGYIGLMAHMAIWNRAIDDDRLWAHFETLLD